MLQPCLSKVGSEQDELSIGAKPGLKCFNPDRFGTKISCIRCSTNFSLVTFHQIHWEKSYSWKSAFFKTPKTRFSRIKRTRLTRASRKQFSWMRLGPMHNRTKFQPDRSSRSSEIGFSKKKVLVFLIYIWPGYYIVSRDWGPLAL